MKILVCTNHFAPLVGGCELVTGKIADAFVGRGHTVYVATRRVRGRNASRYKRYKFVEYTPGDWRRFRLALNDIDPDVIFIYSDVFDFTRHLLAEHQGRIVLALCGANWLYDNKNYVRMVYRHPRLTDIICHSEHDRDYKLCSNSNMGKKTVVIPNGIDLEEFDSNHLGRQELLPEFMQHKWILNVSNFFPGKGQQHIPDILSRLPDKKQYLYLQISSDIDFAIGARLESVWQKECALRLKLNKNVTVKLLKNIPREQVIGYFKSSNAFLFSTEKEVAPIVLLEAMAAELPWVAADVGNARGLQGGKVITAMKDSRYHSVFDDRVKTLFAKSIEDVLAKPFLGEQGRKQIETMTWDKILPRYVSLIEK